MSLSTEQLLTNLSDINVCNFNKSEEVQSKTVEMPLETERWNFPKFKKYFEDIDNRIETVTPVFLNKSNIYNFKNKELICYKITISRGAIKPKEMIIFIKYTKTLEEYQNIIGLIKKFEDAVIISQESHCWGKSKVTNALTLLNGRINSIELSDEINITLGDKIEKKEDNEFNELRILIEEYNKKEKELKQILMKINKCLNKETK